MLGKVVENDEHVRPAIHEIFADRSTREWRKELQGRRCGCRRINDDGVFERSCFAELFYDARGLRFLLAYRDINTDRALLFRLITLVDARKCR